MYGQEKCCELGMNEFEAKCKINRSPLNVNAYRMFKDQIILSGPHG